MKIGVLAAGVAGMLGGGAAWGQDIAAADARGIRIISGQGPLLLTFLAVKKTSTPLDDRTVAEFPLAGVPATGYRAELVLGLSDLDPGAPAGTIDIYTYVGDGVVTEGEFYAGSALTSFQYDSVGVAVVDVTEGVAHAQGQGEYVGFRLSTETADRYFLGSIVGQPEPVLRITRLCYANCDGSTTPPTLNVNDFVCFLNRFGAGDSYANCDGSTVAPVLNVNDFTCFLNRFAAGCP